MKNNRKLTLSLILTFLSHEIENDLVTKKLVISVQFHKFNYQIHKPKQSQNLRDENIISRNLPPDDTFYSIKSIFERKEMPVLKISVAGKKKKKNLKLLIYKLMLKSSKQMDWLICQ